MTINSKKMISLVLVLVLCLSFAACGNKVKLTTIDVETALADRPGTLDIETSGENVKSFTYAIEEGSVKSYAQISLQAPENSVSRRQRCPG